MVFCSFSFLFSSWAHFFFRSCSVFTSPSSPTLSFFCPLTPLTPSSSSSSTFLQPLFSRLPFPLPPFHLSLFSSSPHPPFFLPYPSPLHLSLTFLHPFTDPFFKFHRWLFFLSSLSPHYPSLDPPSKPCHLPLLMFTPLLHTSLLSFPEHVFRFWPSINPSCSSFSLSFLLFIYSPFSWA